MPEKDVEKRSICQSGPYRGKECDCSECRVIGMCVNPGEDGFDRSCSPCTGPVVNCDPFYEEDNESVELRTSAVVIERNIPIDKVVNLKEIIGDTPEGMEDFILTEDLVSSAVLSNIVERRLNCVKALSKFWETPVQIYKITTPEEIFAYITFNGIEDGFLFVGEYPNAPHHIEQAPTQTELNAFKQLLDGDD